MELLLSKAWASFEADKAPIEDIQSLMGHEKSETTRIYAQLSGRLRKEYYQKYF